MVINTRKTWFAFVNDENLIAALQRLPESVGEINLRKGDIDTAINSVSSNKGMYEYLLVEITDCDHPIVKLNELVEKCLQGTRIVVFGSVDHIRFYQDIRMAGIDDYLILPINETRLLDTMMLSSSGGIYKKTNSVVIVSGSRGGAGSSMVAINLSWLLAEQYKIKTALVDLDTYFGISTLALGLEANQGLLKALENIKDIDKVMLTQLMLEKTKNLSVLAATDSLEKEKLYDQADLKILLDLVRKEFIVSVVDLPHYLLPYLRLLSNIISDFIIVSDLSLIALRDTIRRMQWIQKYCPNAVVHIIATKNKENNEYTLTKSQFERQLGKSVEYVLPFNKLLVTTALNRGEPLVRRNNEITKELNKLAQNFYNRQPQNLDGLLGKTIKKIRNWF
ncbi:MAG: hypothetical protein AMJ43_05485 [Coxiella sp. DG_40]|nr:MAG: hypothetical protein AMJ43_05485 [Coxiella sp. DG_40]